MSSRIRSRSLCSRLSRQGFPCSWCGLGAVLLFVMAYPPVAETSSEEIPVLFSTTSQEHTPFTFLQESGQNPVSLSIASEQLHLSEAPQRKRSNLRSSRCGKGAATAEPKTAKPW